MKKVLNIFIIMFLSCLTVFAKSGIELGIFVPLGLSIGINQYSLTNKNPTSQQKTQFESAVKQVNRKSSAGFDAGFLFHIGYRFDINKDFSISLLGELGYNHDEFSFYSISGDKKNENSYVYMFESMSFGIYPKFNWKKFSFGVNVGIKVPLYARAMSSYINYDAKNIDRNIENYNAFQIKDLFDVPIIPYLRVSVDYEVYTDKKFALVLGGYIGGDFGMSFKNTILNNQSIAKITKQTISSFDIGFQVGIRILPNN
ncbi:outer membrane beta-barrel protein [Brachyspira hampsonii]|uniref:Serpentine_recp domain containing protein n=1 Tax=Brachyspira hampsonii 30446 TaxID=1289135 RepID=A0A2U4FQL1_9SPIR|nr:outer membrane beta-barrel protein [Brachyspira hampsonii]EKV57493.1 hypothetical protein A966_05071 [Brachyspira hampsonii 30446]MBW5389272.1 hypothetical protein [Brachyspira hampsonii]MBW5395064.1 hypothetical protein [Brachyspira hampsonii]OEJ19932.1 hypothetical protein A9495_03155 [Brachyspira hampsonii]